MRVFTQAQRDAFTAIPPPPPRATAAAERPPREREAEAWAASTPAGAAEHSSRSLRSASRRPERDEILGAIAAATARALRREAIAQLVDARAAAGASAAALTDLLDGAGAIVDHGIQISFRGRVTDADQHGGEFDNAFQTPIRQGPSRGCTYISRFQVR